MWKEVFAEQAAEQKRLEEKYPFAEILYNWIIAVLIFLLVISFVGWGMRIYTQRQADKQTAAVMAAYKAEQQAIEDAHAQELAAAQRSEEAVMEREAAAIAKAFYGIRNFIGKYHYSDSDLATYARCVFNRVDAGVNSLDAVISQKNQFLGYADSNPVLKEYYDLAKMVVQEWHTESVKPCDTSYRYAELTDQGIFLVNEFGANGYVRRWHA